MLTMSLLFIMAALSFGVQDPCGCPYKPKTGSIYDPSKLAIMDTSSKSCAITCASGYMLENNANYAECTNGVSWIAQQRNGFTTQALIDNPYLTCIKAMPKTCPAGTWKTFQCSKCDATKIFVTPGVKGECTIMCDKGYRLLLNRETDQPLRLTEATLKSASWIMYAFGSIKTSTSATAGTASFNCELIPGSKPRPPTCGCPFEYLEDSAEYDWSQLTASSAGEGSCRVECQPGYALVSDAVTGTFASATCAQREWTATGKGKLASAVPKFSCTKDTTNPGSEACKQCAANLITVTVKPQGGARPMTSDTTDTSGACAVRTFVCEGPTANIEINGGEMGTVEDKGRVTFSVNCNAGGTAWTACGHAITQLECAAGGLR